MRSVSKSLTETFSDLSQEKKPLLSAPGTGDNRYCPNGKLSPIPSYSSTNADDSSSLNDSGSTTSNDGKSFTKHQWILLIILGLVTLTSSFSVCLFPPFFPRIAEEKGASATVYGAIIGTNCLVSFLVTPFVGKHLETIGIKFAFVVGSCVSGICCILSGFLEFYPPGLSFAITAAIIRAVHAVGNAGVITATFTYTALEFPDCVAQIFSFTRTVMNVAQLAGPILGGALYEVGGFSMPFVVLGSFHTIISFFSVFFLPTYENEDRSNRPGSEKVTLTKLLSIPTIWFAFLTFIVSTMTNGFLSINLEPKILRQFDLSPLYVGLIFGLKDGTNSVATPVWGYLADRSKSVKPFIIFSALLAVLSLILLEPFAFFAVNATLGTVIAALSINGVAIGGQQVAGVVDALREAIYSGFPDDPSTHGMVAGIWSSFSGAGRFISRTGSGFLVDNLGFGSANMVVLMLQLSLAAATSLYLFCKCCQNLETRSLTSSLSSYLDPEEGKPFWKKDKTRARLPTDTTRNPRSRANSQTRGSNANKYAQWSTNQLHYIEGGEGGRRISVTQTTSPCESVMCKSVSLPVHNFVRKPRANSVASSTPTGITVA